MAGKRHFGNVRRLPSGRYQASYWHLGQRHIAERTFATKAEANAFLDTTSARIHGREWVDPGASRIPFAEYANRWLEERTDLRPSTRDQYRWLLDVKVLPFFGTVALERITPVDVRAWFAELAAVTPAAARSAYRLVRAIFNTAVTDELLAKNPCRIRGAGSDRAPERTIPTVTEVAALADAMPQALRCAVLLAAWGTLRRGEVFGLQRRDVDTERGTVHVRRSATELRNGELVLGPPKTKAGTRVVHLPEPVVAALAEHLERFCGPDPEDPVFPAQGNKVLRPRTFTTFWTDARRRTGLLHVRFHDLRHFAGTMAAVTGASTRELMARGGWSTVAMVTHYQHASEDRDAFLAKAMTPFVLPSLGDDDAEDGSAGDDEEGTAQPESAGPEAPPPPAMNAPEGAAATPIGSQMGDRARSRTEEGAEDPEEDTGHRVTPLTRSDAAKRSGRTY